VTIEEYCVIVSKLFFYSKSKEGESMKLFCFPHAGGYSTYYHFIREASFKNIDEVILYDYPRYSFNKRAGDIQFKWYIDSAVDFLKKSVSPDDEYIIFGHSMGAFIACETGLSMQNTYNIPPHGVIVSGQNPPYSERYEKGWCCPENPKEYVMKLGGVPDFLKNVPKLMDAMMRCIESDMMAITTYEPSEVSDDKLLACGMLLRGKCDPLINPDYARYWNKTFKNIHSETVFPGDHFYFKDSADAVIELIDEFAGDIVKEFFYHDN
jgi:surfactin synthase thioesterase subunit